MYVCKHAYMQTWYVTIYVIPGSSAVQSLSLQHVAWSDSLSVSWQPPAHPRGTITRYTLSYQLTQRGTCARVEGHWSGAIPVTSPYRITRLDPHSEYRVKVVPVSGAGDGVEATMDARTAATGKLSVTWLHQISKMIVEDMVYYNSRLILVSS